jgi:hypothetical protein
VLVRAGQAFLGDLAGPLFMRPGRWGTGTLSDQQGACVNPAPSTGASYCPRADIENVTAQMERALLREN